MSQVHSDMASTTSATVSKKPTDISPSAYAMSTSVERSAECVLAVLSSNTTIPPNYGRSISSPCGSAPTTTNTGSSSPKKVSPNQKVNTDYESPSSLMSTSPSLSRKSYPGATSSDHNSSSYPYQQQQQQQQQQEQEQEQEQEHHQQQQSQPPPTPPQSQEKFEDSVSNQPDLKEEIVENEDDSYDCDDGPSISEDRSLTESIPDSFHTPSASIQNLSVTASKQLAAVNASKNSNNSHPGYADGLSTNSSARASTRSTASSKGSGSDSGHGGNEGSGSDRGNPNLISSAVSNGSSSKCDKDKDSSSISSSGSGKNQKESPKQKKESNTPKGSPEGAQQLSNKVSLDGSQQPLGNLSPELTASVESNVSKDSSSSSGKETIVISPQYGPKPNKKKMWYHVFYPSYKTRSGDFKRIFKDLPSEERLIVDYSCALQREILIQGRMYVSQNYISFYANIFGWETQTSIRLKDVTAITKEKTALVIPNAVQVSTESERFFFTSFVTRDATYVMLFKLWQSSLLEDVRNTLPTKEIWKLVHSCYGEELGVASEEDAEDFLTCTSGSLVNAPSVTTLMSDGDDSKSINGIDVQVCASDLGPGIALPLEAVVTSGENSPAVLGLPEHGVGISGPTTDASDSSESDGEHETIIGSHEVLTDDSNLDIPVCPVLHTEGREVLNTVIPTDVDTLFTMLFTSSKFFLDFHTMRKTFDIVQSPWQQSPDGSQKIRQVSFTVTLNHVMGPKHTQLTESQVMLPVSKPGRMYAIDVESVNAGIPYADSFYVTTHFCLSRLSPNETKMCVVNQIKYKKSVWKYTKGFIEKNTWAGLEEFYTNLDRALKEECAKINCISQSTPVAAIIAGSAIPRRRNGRKKGPAPGIPLDVTPLQPLVAIMRNGSIPNASILAVDNATVSSGSQTTAESSVVLKIILAVLACLLLLNAFLYVKLTRFETSKHHLPFQPQPISFPKNVPRNHDEWVTLLQQQEDLHRLELQKWHEILLSALKILHQAEEDLESLKYHITSYSNGKFSVSALKDALESIHSSSNPTSPNPSQEVKQLEDNLLISKEPHEAQGGSGDEDSGTGSTNDPKSENLQHSTTTENANNIQGDTESERTRTSTSNNINDEL